MFCQTIRPFILKFIYFEWSFGGFRIFGVLDIDFRFQNFPLGLWKILWLKILSTFPQSNTRLGLMLCLKKKIRPLLNKMSLAFELTSMDEGSDALASTLKNFHSLAKLILLMYSGPLGLFTCLSILNYIFYGNVTLILEVYIPGINHEALIGYVLVSILHLIFIFFGISGFFIIDFIILSSSYFSLTMNQLFRIRLKNTENFLKNTDMKIPKNQAKMRKLMKEIYASHQFILE